MDRRRISPSSERVTLARPTTPYISLDDPNLQDFFNREGVRKHLRTAGLLNREGNIVTEKEYENRQTNRGIRAENRRKITEVVTEILNDMGKEHWGITRDHLQATEKKLLQQLKHIEKDYARRYHRITIAYDREGILRGDSPRVTTNPEPRSRTRSQKPASPTPAEDNRSQSAERSSELERHRTNSNQNAKPNISANSMLDERLRCIDQSIKILFEQHRSTEKELARFQEQYREEKRTPGESQRQSLPPFRSDENQVLAQSKPDVDQRVAFLEAKIAELSTRIDRIPPSVTSNEYTLSHQAITNSQTQPSRNDDEYHSVIHRMEKLDERLEQLARATEQHVTGSIVEELINREMRGGSSRKEVSQFQLENLSDSESSQRSVPPQSNQLQANSIDGRNQQPNVRHYHIDASSDEGPIVESDEGKSGPTGENARREPNLKAKKVLIKSSKIGERKTIRDDTRQRQATTSNPNKQRDAQSQQPVKELRRSLDNRMRHPIHKIQRKQDSPRGIPIEEVPRNNTSQSDAPRLNKDLTIEELQFIMPFIEYLPTFDMFYKDEWN